MEIHVELGVKHFSLLSKEYNHLYLNFFYKQKILLEKSPITSIRSATVHNYKNQYK